MKRIVGTLSSAVMILAIALLSNSVRAESPYVTPVSYEIQSPSAITWHRDLESGWRESRRTGRPMVIFITAAHCRYCDAMKSATWHDRSVESRVAADFVAVQLCPEENSAELSRVQVNVYPTTIVALPQGKVVDHRKGFQTPALLHGLLSRVAR